MKRPKAKPLPDELLAQVKAMAEERPAIKIFDIRDYRLDLESEPRAPVPWKVTRQGRREE